MRGLPEESPSASTDVQTTRHAMVVPAAEVRYPALAEDHLLHEMRIRIADIETADSAVELDLGPRVTNHAGALQGGIIATLVDVVAGLAISRVIELPATWVTRDLSLHYLGLLAYSPVRAEARVRSRTTRNVVVQVDVADGRGALGAIATITFAVRSGVPRGGQL